MSVQDDLIKQILGSSNTSKWTGQGYGSAEKNAADMAKILAGIGITDIKQFGKIPQYDTQTQYKGQPVSVDEEGTPYIMVPGPGLDDYGNPMPARQNVDPSQVQQVQVQVGEAFGNKATGQVVPTTYSERQTGDFFGGTFEGKGNTGYGVQFRPDGTPVFYTQGASSNDLANIMQMAGPVGQIALAVATGGLSIPQQIAANMAIQVLSGKDIGDAIKGAAVSFAMAQIPGTDIMKDGVKYIEKMGLGETLTNTLSNSFQNAAMSGAKALLTGQNIGDAVLAGAATGGINGAINAITNNVDGFKDLSPSQQKMVVNAVTGVVSGKPLDQILINSAIAAANAEVHTAKTQPSTDGVDKTTVGNFDDTEVTRLEKMGYTKDQIKEYFGRLENLTDILDNPQETLPVEDTKPNTRSLGGDPVKALEDAGLKYLPTDDDFVPTVRDPNELEIVSGKLPTYLPTDDDFVPTVRDPNELEIVGKRPVNYLPTDDDFMPTPIKDEGNLEIVGNRPVNYLPTDDDFMPTPIKDEGEMEIVGDRPKEEEPPAEKPTTPGATPTPKVTTPGVKPTTVAPTAAARPTAQKSAAQEVAPARLGIPGLGNVFYYGKDFSSQKQELDPSGRLVQQEYDPLSVTQAGAELQLDKIAGSNENDVQALIQQIMANSGGNISPEELAQILGQQGASYGV